MELLASRKKHPQNTIVNIGKVHFGDGNLTAIAGPCTIESKEQLFAIAEAVKASGADLLRAAHISQELLPIPSAVWDLKASNICWKPDRKPDFPSYQKSWKSRIFHSSKMWI